MLTGSKTPGGAGTHTCLPVPVKRHRGSRDTHGAHTRGTRAHKGTRITPTNLTTIQIHQHTHNPHVSATAETAARQTQGLNSRRPGADRSPRSTQKRPPPANPTLPPPAPRAPLSPRLLKGSRRNVARAAPVPVPHSLAMKCREWHSPRVR